MVKEKKFFLLLIITVLIIISAAIAGVYFIRDIQGTKITLTFSDAKGLYEKGPVEYKGIQIGSVQKVEANQKSKVSVLIKINSNQAEHVRQNALFVISQTVSTGKPPGILVGYCKDQDPYQLPEMTSGSVVSGEESELIFTIKTHVGCFSETTNNLSNAIEALKQNIDSVLTSQKARQLFHDIEAFFMELSKTAQDQIRHFMEEKGPEIREKIEELIKELERMGHKRAAEEWKKFLNDEFQHET